MTKSESIDKLAREFCKQINLELCPAILEDVNRINKERNDNTCATHDFTDANMVMDTAFKIALGYEYGLSNEYDLDILNTAWGVAKLYEFKLGVE